MHPVSLAEVDQDQLLQEDLENTTKATNQYVPPAD